MPARKLIAMEDRIRRLESGLRAGHWSYDMRSRVLEWSHGFYALFGLKPEAVMPDATVAGGLVHPEDQQEWGEILTLAKRSRQTDRIIRIIRPDGQMIRALSHYEGQFDRSGNLVAVHGTLIDVSQQATEREEAEKAWTFARSLRTLSQGVVWRAGPDGRLLDMDDWFRLTGETPEQARDWATLAAVHADDRDTFRAAWQRGFDEKTPISYRARVRDRSGKYVVYESRALPILDDQGEVLEWHGFSLPIPNGAAQSSKRLTSAQVRAARALIDWSGPDLAERSGVSFSTIKRMEKSEELVKLDSVQRVRSTLEQAGVSFSTGANGEVSVTIKVG